MTTLDKCVVVEEVIFIVMANKNIGRSCFGPWLAFNALRHCDHQRLSFYVCFDFQALIFVQEQYLARVPFIRMKNEVDTGF